MSKWYNAEFLDMLAVMAGQKPLSKSLSEVITPLTSKEIIDLEITHCSKCVNHENCIVEDTFKFAGIKDGYCAAGRKDEPI